MAMSKKRAVCSKCGGPCDYRVKTCRSCSSVRIDPKTRLAGKSAVVRDGCHLFTGFCLPNGYGRILGMEGKPVLAHRLAWELHHGQKVPHGLCVCHRCDVRSCVNPEHLFVGTHGDNMVDMVSKGRASKGAPQPKQRGERNWHTKFTSLQVAEIRRRKSEPRKKLAAEFGSSPRYISSLIAGVKRRYDGDFTPKAGK